MITAKQLTADNISAFPPPDWAAGAIVDTLDEGNSMDRCGAYGYECHALRRDGKIVGYVYDLGDGYDWTEAEPEPYSPEERGHSLAQDYQGRWIDFDAASHYMDDEIREELVAQGITDPTDFIRRYAERHADQFDGEEFAPYYGGAW